MKNSNYIIENRSRDLTACTAVPQTTASPHTPLQGKISAVPRNVGHLSPSYVAPFSRKPETSRIFLFLGFIQFLVLRKLEYVCKTVYLGSPEKMAKSRHLLIFHHRDHHLLLLLRLL
jgi:hypothetical protein